MKSSNMTQYHVSLFHHDTKYVYHDLCVCPKIIKKK